MNPTANAIFAAVDKIDQICERALSRAESVDVKLKAFAAFKLAASASPENPIILNDASERAREILTLCSLVEAQDEKDYLAGRAIRQVSEFELLNLANNEPLEQALARARDFIRDEDERQNAIEDALRRELARAKFLILGDVPNLSQEKAQNEASERLERARALVEELDDQRAYELFLAEIDALDALVGANATNDARRDAAIEFSRRDALKRRDETLAAPIAAFVRARDVLLELAAKLFDQKDLKILQDAVGKEATALFDAADREERPTEQSDFSADSPALIAAFAVEPFGAARRLAKLGARDVAIDLMPLDDDRRVEEARNLCEARELSTRDRAALNAKLAARLFAPSVARRELAKDLVRKALALLQNLESASDRARVLTALVQLHLDGKMSAPARRLAALLLRTLEDIESDVMRDFALNERIFLLAKALPSEELDPALELFDDPRKKRVALRRIALASNDDDATLRAALDDVASDADALEPTEAAEAFLECAQDFAQAAASK